MVMVVGVVDLVTVGEEAEEENTVVETAGAAAAAGVEGVVKVEAEEPD